MLTRNYYTQHLDHLNPERQLMETPSPKSKPQTRNSEINALKPKSANLIKLETQKKHSPLNPKPSNLKPSHLRDGPIPPLAEGCLVSWNVPRGNR